MAALQMLVLAARFALELAALVAVGWWGFRLDAGWPLRTVVGLGGPLAVATVWGLFLAPRADARLADPGLFLAEVAVFLVAGLALAGLGRPGWGAGYVTAATLTSVLVRVWGL